MLRFSKACIASLSINNCLAALSHARDEHPEVLIGYRVPGLGHSLPELRMREYLINAPFLLNVVLHHIPDDLYRIQIRRKSWPLNRINSTLPEVL